MRNSAIHRNGKSCRNGGDHDYLLTAWYKHTFQLGETHLLGITGGIVDATAYLDQHAYASDEYTQFFNPTLVVGPNGFAPYGNIGGAVQWDTEPFYANGVVMNDWFALNEKRYVQKVDRLTATLALESQLGGFIGHDSDDSDRIPVSGCARV